MNTALISVSSWFIKREKRRRRLNFFGEFHFPLFLSLSFLDSMHRNSWRNPIRPKQSILSFPSLKPWKLGGDPNKWSFSFPMLLKVWNIRFLFRFPNLGAFRVMSLNLSTFAREWTILCCGWEKCLSFSGKVGSERLAHDDGLRSRTKWMGFGIHWSLCCVCDERKNRWANVSQVSEAWSPIAVAELCMQWFGGSVKNHALGIESARNAFVSQRIHCLPFCSWNSSISFHFMQLQLQWIGRSWPYAFEFETPSGFGLRDFATCLMLDNSLDQFQSRFPHLGHLSSFDELRCVVDFIGVKQESFDFSGDGFWFLSKDELHRFWTAQVHCEFARECWAVFPTCRIPSIHVWLFCWPKLEFPPNQ